MEGWGRGYYDFHLLYYLHGLTLFFFGGGGKILNFFFWGIGIVPTILFGYVNLCGYFLGGMSVYITYMD